MEEKTAYRARLSENESELLKVLRKYPKSEISKSVLIERSHSIDYLPKFRSADRLQILSGHYKTLLFIVVSRDTYPFNKCAVSVGHWNKIIERVQSWIKQDPWLYKGLPSSYKFLLKETEGRF